MADRYLTTDDHYQVAVCSPRAGQFDHLDDENSYGFVVTTYKARRPARMVDPGYVLNKRWQVVLATMPAAPESVETRFAELLARWRKETAGFSIARQKQYHPTYLKIIGLGDEALPLLLKQIEAGRRYLFLAIESIAGIHLTPNDGTFEDAKRVWLRWGKERKFALMALEEIEHYFPQLEASGYQKTSAETEDYNCFAWALGLTDRRFDPTETPDSHWPAEVHRSSDLSSIEQLFQSYGYERCEKPALEAGFEKIALYADESSGEATHACRQLPDGRWTSKIGDLEDIAHNQLEVLEGYYGRLVRIMRRRLMRN